MCSYIKITTVYVPSSELVLPQSLSCKRVCPPPPPGPKGGGAHSPLAKGVGESKLWRLEKKLSTLPILCAVNPPIASDPPSSSPVPTLVGSWNFGGWLISCSWQGAPHVGPLGLHLLWLIQAKPDAPKRGTLLRNIGRTRSNFRKNVTSALYTRQTVTLTSKVVTYCYVSFSSV